APNHHLGVASSDQWKIASAVVKAPSYSAPRRTGADDLLPAHLRAAPEDAAPGTLKGHHDTLNGFEVPLLFFEALLLGAEVVYEAAPSARLDRPFLAFRQRFRLVVRPALPKKLAAFL